jgi:hypothetical protein
LRPRSQPIAGESDRVGVMVAFLSPLADAATEGKHVVFGMLIVGLIFVSVIAIGQLSKWLGHRREH